MATPRGPFDPITVGVDIGNATTSVATAAGVLAFFPSVLTTFGIGPYDGLSKVAGTIRHHVDYGDMHAVVGADAFDMYGADTLLAEGEQAQSRYTDPASFLCFLAGISASFPLADTVAVNLATGAPLSVYETRRAEIVTRYRGRHTYGYNGHERTVIVNTVQVYGEGREAMRLLTPEQRRGNIAVHDVGGRTWNVLFFRDGALKRSQTFNLGTDRLFDTISTSAPRDAAVRWEMQAEMRANPKSHAPIRKALEKAALDALAIIERKLALSQADMHCLMGGGALYLPGPIKFRYGKPVTTLNGDAPEAANALAYAIAASEV